MRGSLDWTRSEPVPIAAGSHGCPIFRTPAIVMTTSRRTYESALSSDLFRRLDESSDSEFYAVPRFVTHIDDATIAALTALYRELIPRRARILDLMSSWVSHLPADVDTSGSRVSA